MKTHRLRAATPSSGARACLRACPQPFFTVLLPLAAALAALSAPPPAYAQAAPATAAQSESARVYAIAPGPLNDALAAFARQAGISLGYSSSQLSGARSAGLSGQYGVAEGLRALLAGTGYRAVNVDGGIRVEAEPPSATSTLAPVLVTGAYHAQTEGTQSYGSSMATIGKTEQALKDIPQSVTVVTRKRLDDQNLSTISEVLELSLIHI